ncbi:iron complex outermembrane recepter protein [Desulfuromusa kysingii]|uniref:Iron complex outermembrane recepter protein n=1 Tax=Desulfuromusa kysingii TaxID=37625 RepID=A0A1H3YJI0_9BACT|nr:TonB-dependent receptor [Desulfuromusa kysingii]SEA11700.1 iron complex outermembrane recepter protein [Desulfuromusa kysingii]
MKRKIIYLVAILLIGCNMTPFSAKAEEAVLLGGGELEALYGDEEFVSIATGRSKPVYKAPAVASVITAEDISRMGARTLDDVLESVPGLHVGVSNQGRLDSVYSIRGIHTSFNPQVLVLMNGIAFPAISSGRPFQFRLPVTAIERVEIIRGPGSAIYGADAYSGVINIITKDAETMGSEVGMRTGSFDTQNLWLQHSAHRGDLSVAVSLEWLKTDGDDSRKISSDLQTSLDSIFGTSASLAPGELDTRYNVFNSHLDIGYKKWHFRHWYWKQDDAGLGAGAALALDPVGGEDYDLHLLDLTYQDDNLTKNWSIKLNLSYYNLKNKSRFVLLPPGTTVPVNSDGNLELSAAPAGIVTFTDGMLGNPEGTQEQSAFEIVSHYSGLKSHQFRVATGLKYFSGKATKETKNFGPGVIDGTSSPIDGTLTDVAGTSNIFMIDPSRTLWYLSLQDEWQLARDWELTGGIRYDHYSDFGTTVNPRIALVWSTRQNLTTKLLYGKAFRAPTFNEKSSINNPVALGNPDLDPEIINTIELSFDYRPTFNLQSILSTYYYIAEDLIEFVPDPGQSTITAQNNRDLTGYGCELEIIWKALQNLKITGNYAWQHTEDRDTGKQIADVPVHQIYLETDWQFAPQWFVNTQLNWIAERKRSQDDSRKQLDDYSLVNLNLSRKNIYNHWDFSLAIKNLFDENATEPSNITIYDDYSLEERSIWAQIRYRF